VSRASRRFYRSTALGVAAMGALVWVAFDQFDISLEAMADLFLSTLFVAGVIIIGAAAFVAVLVGLRKLLKRFNSN